MDADRRLDDALRIPPDSTRNLFSDISPYYEDGTAARPVVYDFSYMLARARFACPGVIDADLQEIAQEALIAYTRHAASEHIDDPEAYIARIILNKFRDHLRRRQREARLPLMSFSTFTDNPDMEVAASARAIVNPANELDEKLSLAEFCDDLAAALARMPSRQQRVLICTMVYKADDPSLLIGALKAHHINESQMRWPEDNREKRVLQASLPAARRALANLLQIDLSQYKQKTRRPHGSSSPEAQP